MDTDHEPGERNSSGCSRCAPCDSPTPEGTGDPPLSGWRLALASMGLFLAPGILAIAGAVCSSGSQGAQFLGAIAGLAIGMTGAVVLVKLPRRARKVVPTKKTS